MTATNAAVDGRLVKLAGVVLVAHLAVNVVHSVAHVEIPVFLAPGLTAVIVATYFLGPVAGGVLLWRGRVRAGAALFAVSMAAGFGLGLALHVLLPNPDNVAAIPAGPWHGPFRLSALAFLGIDAAGGALGGWLWWITDRRDDPLPSSGRVDGVPESGFRPLTRLVYWGARNRLGEVPESLTVTAHHGRVLSGVTALELALDGADRVDDRLTELAVLKTAMLVGCEFCIDIGTAEATELGVTKAQLRALSEFEESDAFSERERLALRYAEAMAATPTDVPDELFEALTEAFEEPQLVELTAAIAFENYRARFNRAFGIDVQGFTAEEFCPLPAPSPVDPETRRSESLDD